MVHGYTFDSIQGTLEVIPNCLSYMTCVTREPSGELEVDFEGETKVNWDAQKPMLAEDGQRIWVTTEDDGVDEDTCVIVPENFEDVDLDDPKIDLPVRPALVDALLAFIRAAKIESSVRRELSEGPKLRSRMLETVEKTIGFAAIHPERAALLAKLKS